MKLLDTRYLWRDFKQGIKNLITWFPVIWNDRQWDHWYFYTLLHKKLSLMENFFRHSGIHTNAVSDADKIKICVLLLERLKEDNYLMNAMKRHDEKWGESEFNSKESKSHPGFYELDITYDKVKTAQHEKEQKRDFKNASERERYLMEQDLDMLFSSLRKNIQSWWD
ncbi:MAG: hypothetical protein K9L62_10645 [Vallitaleaceae bacterium]|nr:hypothetical protein [Vallitaleaceae bacterium]